MGPYLAEDMKHKTSWEATQSF